MANCQIDSRTENLSALQMMLEYVSRELVSRGHPFAAQCCLVAYASTKLQTSSPQHTERLKSSRNTNIRSKLIAELPPSNTTKQLNHRNLWQAIDALANKEGISTAELAIRAGLGVDTFSASNRVSATGCKRWPELDEIAQALNASKTTLDEFLAAMA